MHWGLFMRRKKTILRRRRLFRIVSKFKMDLGSFGLGYAFGLLNENEDAWSAYDRAIQLNPQYPEGLDNKGVALGKLNRLEDALAAFDKAIELNPQFPRPGTIKALHLANWTGTRRNWQPMIKLSSSNLSILRHGTARVLCLEQFEPARGCPDRLR